MKEMKIGTLTLPLHTNYGGILQAYALTIVLKKQGHDVFLINQQFRNIPKWKYPLTVLKRLVLKHILNHKNINVLMEIQLEKERAYISQNIKPFIERYFASTDLFSSPEELAKKIGSYDLDAIIVGSDQVWRPIYTYDIKSYFLEFLKSNTSTKRISYAASFGTSDWEFSDEETKACKDLLEKFDAVSVREDTGAKLCQEYFGISPTHVLDPTMLLDTDEYLKLIDLTEKRDGDLLVYVLDKTDDKISVINTISEMFNMKPFSTNVNTEDFSIPKENRIAPPVENWIKGFHDAKFVITDSFHAVVFSILFNKPFIVYGNQGRGMARFNSLLKMFGLEKRFITNSKDINTEVLTESIDWVSINDTLRLKRIDSELFLHNSLTH